MIGSQGLNGFPSVPERVPVGTVAMYAAATAPTGWLLCDGSAVRRAKYSALFDLIGTTFGSGDGTSTFNLPDFQGRSPVGAGTGTGLSARTLGTTGGAETHALSSAELPSHRHQVYDPWDNSDYVWDASGAMTNGLTGSAGSGTAHANMAPWVALSFMIKAL